MPLADRSPELLHRDQSRLLIVDVQEKLLPTIADGDDFVNNVRWLAEAARLSGVPIDITEQYPQGLGPTVSPLQEFAPERPSKRRFSGVAALGWGSALEAPEGRDQIVLAGMETHVCILQTAFDLLAFGYRVYLAADAVRSRRAIDQATAIQRMRDAGAVVTTSEGIAFEWQEDAEGPAFKALSALVKERPV